LGEQEKRAWQDGSINPRPRVDAAPMPLSGPRPPASLYLAGPFSMGYVDFFTFLIPLYGLWRGLDAFKIGVLVGVRSILALFRSIHIGGLMDRFGTRAVTLVFVWIGMALAPRFHWRRASGRCCCSSSIAEPSCRPLWIGGSGRGEPSASNRRDQPQPILIARKAAVS
jgi:hypothetical protein